MKKIILLILVLLVIAGAIYYFEKMKLSTATNSEDGETVMLKDGKYPKAPELTGIGGYINAEEGLKISDFEGKVVLIDFWTYTCINCIRTLPFLKEWDEKYRDKGLVIIGVHTPEFPFEKEYENVLEAVEKEGIKYAVVQDNDYATWRAYNNRYWPHKYLIDSEGFIRYDHIGEGAYDETEKKIQELLAEIGEDVTDIGVSDLEDETPRIRLTPELYAGYEFALSRGQDIGNEAGLKPEEIFDYKLPEEIKKDLIYLEGKWKSNKDNLEALEDASIILSFTAGKVNVVGDAIGDSVKLEVFINVEYVKEEQAGDDVEFEDGKAFVLIDEPRLYNVINGEHDNFKLTLLAENGFTFHAFTFG